MKKYKILVSNGQGWAREYVSQSRNARAHLAENYGEQDGARCTVYIMRGDAVSECRFSAEFGYYYIAV